MSEKNEQMESAVTAAEMDAVAEYSSRTYLYEVFAARISDLIQRLIPEDVDVDQVRVRVKSVESFAQKIGRKGYVNPLEEMVDLVGVRIITHYEADIEVISQILMTEFKVKEGSSSPGSAPTEADRFGYRSYHYVLSLSDERRLLPEWSAFGDIQFEVQARTVLQHAWASISHRLDYKVEAAGAPDLRRRLFRMSALIEIADSQFSELRDASARIRKLRSAELSSGVYDLPLTQPAVETYLRGSMGARVKAAVRTAGFAVVEDDANRRGEDLRDLVETLLAFGVNRIKDLDALLNEHQLIDIVRILGNEARWAAKRPEGTLEDALTQVLLVRVSGSEQVPDVYTPSVRAAISRAREVAGEAGISTTFNS